MQSDSSGCKGSGLALMLSTLNYLHTSQERAPRAISDRARPLVLQVACGPYWFVTGPPIVVQLKREKGLVILGEPGPVTGRINQQRS